VDWPLGWSESVDLPHSVSEFLKLFIAQVQPNMRVPVKVWAGEFIGLFELDVYGGFFTF
jgi:hypothetical protein